MPKFSSREEYERWKAQKIEEDKERAHKIKIAKEIVRYKPTSEIDDLFEENAPPKPFVEQLPGIFSYPFKGHGKYVLIAGILFFWILGFFMFIPLLGIFIAIFVGGYMCAYIMKIISSSANGKDEVPDWPDFTDFWDDILSPAFKVIGVAVLCFAPSIIYLFVFSSSQWQTDPVLWGLIVAGALYYPMGLLAVAQTDSVQSLNPLFIVPSIIKVPLDYLVAFVVLLLIIALSTVAEKILVLPIPIVGSITSEFLSLYFLMVEMRILGLLYYANQERLGWFGEGDEI